MSGTATILRPAMVKQLERAIECTVKVARLYKKHGKPPVFTPIEPEYNPPRQRARLARLAPAPVQNVCSRCGLLFIAPAEKRCQCKVRTKRKAVLV